MFKQQKISWPSPQQTSTGFSEKKVNFRDKSYALKYRGPQGTQGQSHPCKVYFYLAKGSQIQIFHCTKTTNDMGEVDFVLAISQLSCFGFA